MDSPTGYLYRTALNVVRSRARRRTNETSHAPNPLSTDSNAAVRRKANAVGPGAALIG